MRVDERGSVGFTKTPPCNCVNCVIGDQFLESVARGELVKKYTPLRSICGSLPSIAGPLCILLLRSHPVTVIATQSRRNQRNGSFVRNLFFMRQRLLPYRWNLFRFHSIPSSALYALP